MKFTILTTAFLAAVSTAAPLARRAVTFTNNAYVAAVGSPLTINWSGASGAATINLKSGEPGNLQTTATIASNTWGTSTTWTPPTTGTYALEIIDESGAINYSPPFYVGTAVARRQPRFSLSRWLLDQPQVRNPDRSDHIRRDGKETETESKLKDLALKKDLVKIPDWKETLLAPLDALTKAFASPWNKVVDKTKESETAKQPDMTTEVVGPNKEVVVTKGPWAGHVEVKESTSAGETFTQGDGWKNDNFRHGTWTSKSKDAGKSQTKPEQESFGEALR